MLLKSQLSFEDQTTIFQVKKINTDKIIFNKISSGFQHSLFLTSEGEVYGCGKSDKNQLGKEFSDKILKKDPLGYFLFYYLDITFGLSKIDTNGIEGKIVDIAAGKYHSTFLTGFLFLY